MSRANGESALVLDKQALANLRIRCERRPAEAAFDGNRTTVGSQKPDSGSSNGRIPVCRNRGLWTRVLDSHRLSVRSSRLEASGLMLTGNRGIGSSDRGHTVVTECP